MWDTTANIMVIPYHENVKILGIPFTSTTSQSALKRWSIVTDGIRAQAREAYHRELSLNKRIQFAHTYMLARVWFIAQVLLMPLTCERQINTALTRFLWRGSIFRVPLSTIQRRKLQGGWDLINVGAKVEHYSTSVYKHRVQHKELYRRIGYGSGICRPRAPTSPRSNGYQMALSTCVSTRWMVPTLPRNGRMKRAKHISVAFTTPWLHSYERRQNSQSCGSHVSGIVQTERRYGVKHT